MNHLKTTIFIIASIYLFSPCLAQKSKSEKRTLLDNWNKLDRFVSLAKKKQPDLSFYTALVYNGKVISEKQMGYANIKNKVKMNRHMVHMWGSVSKLFTTVAILQLVEKGQLKLTDSITHYFPNLGKKTGDFAKINQVKIHHLINHNSGLSLTKAFRTVAAKIKKEEKKFRRAENEEFLPYLELAEQTFPAGEKYEYSNMGYSLLGLVIEKVSGIKFKVYIKQNILKPLRMKSTSYGPLSKKMMKKFAAYYGYYDQDKDGKREKLSHISNYSQGILAANGGIRASPNDMVKFMNFLRFRKSNKRAEKVLKRATLQKYLFDADLDTIDNQNVVFLRKNKGIKLYYVNGFRVRVEKKNIGIGHSGKVATYISYFIFNKKMPFGVMMTSNIYSDPKGTPYKLIDKLSWLITKFAVNGDFGQLINLNENEF
ncbi:serine hydrolase [uncultured Microscilla sp.]|uniref:serine hydrolase domain-containing protein n=1 Tax=uncultured Microscilla sp. TaxID=432653 RepID=UPI00260F6162|nr:serine hydrolase domain-containing protein [uncultured Microscilla sp.]